MYSGESLWADPVIAVLIAAGLLLGAMVRRWFAVAIAQSASEGVGHRANHSMTRRHQETGKEIGSRAGGDT